MYIQRRDRLYEDFTGCVVVVGGRDTALRNGDGTYAFRQDSSMLYLTGVDLPGVAGVFYPDKRRWVLYRSPPSKHAIMWSGVPLGVKQLQSRYGCYRVADMRDLEADLRKVDVPIHGIGVDFRVRRKALARWLVQQRLVKDAYELSCLDCAAALTREAIDGLDVRSGVTEQVLRASLTYAYERYGCTHAFHPIVTVHGEVLHQELYTNTLRSGDMLLVDTGIEYEGYSGDISRSMVVGKMSKVQRSLLNCVRMAQSAAVKCLRPGCTFDELQRAADAVIVQGLIDAGVLVGEYDAVIASGVVRVFFPHAIGHHIGLDTHDCSDLGVKKTPLVVHNVITIEPGIYFNGPYLSGVPQKYKKYIHMHHAMNLTHCIRGIRIEDMYVIEPSGCRQLGEGGTTGI